MSDEPMREEIPPPTQGDDDAFRRELASVLNRYSRENGSNTPDFILADYLATCLSAWDMGVHARDRWYGRVDRSGVLIGPGHIETDVP
jgi:hypothetical protein